jgi:putative hydrolase of the HAD superfamily
VMMCASAGALRGCELQSVAAEFGLGDGIVPELVQIVRDHQPTLRLPYESAHALRALRPAWRLAIVTNGPPDVQARKVAALGLATMVDAVVYAADHGTGRGKPERAPFEAALRQIGVGAERAVFVGDNETCDLHGASGAGMQTILTVRYRPLQSSVAADAIVGSLLDVPQYAELLVPLEGDHRVVA